LTVDLTRICFPYLMLMSLTALQGGVLNSLSRFTAAAAAPILLNLVMISANGVAWWYGTGNSPATGYIFAWGIFAAGLAQFALLAITCRRAGMPILPGFPKLTPDVKRLIWLTGPGILSGGIIQINLLIATIIASGFPGAVAYLYYADRLYQLPLGIIGAAIGVVLLPDLSRKLRANDQQGLSNSQNRALEMSLFLTVPAAVALMAIPMPIVRTVFEHGAFHRGDTAAVAPAVTAFAASLPAFSMTKVFQPGFYAREDTRTPMVFAMISVAVNIAASLLLSRWIGHVGIALATSIAAWVNAACLGVTLAKRGHYAPDDRLRKRLPATLSAAFAMGLLLLGLQWLLRSSYVEGAGFHAAVLGLIALVGLGGASFFLFAHLLGAMTLKEAKSLIRR
jgi:putative peptidoglycan lipid II flippase